MKISVDDLSREEMRNLMKPLSIESLRVPVKENAKLEKNILLDLEQQALLMCN